MLRQLRAVAGLTLVGLVTLAACGDDTTNGSNGKGGEPSDGGEGGEAGSNAKGGGNAKGGSNAKAGSGGGSAKGGSGGGGSAKGGSGGTGGSGGSAVVGGAGGAGGEGGEGPQCSACASGFCLPDGTCVDCLPSDDQCPGGQYCSAENTCAEGCKASGEGCASGVCDNTHNCSNCINDGECVGELVCSSGKCGDACAVADEGQQAQCGDGLTCCSEHCTNVEYDSNNCGACGATCGNGEFCGIDSCTDTGQGSASSGCVACHPVTLASICSIPHASVILDEGDGDRVAGRAIGAALHEKCNPKPTLSEAEQSSVEALNLQSGQPVSGGKELLVVAGGPFFQNLEGYLEDQGIAPLYWHYTDTHSMYSNSANDEIVVMQPREGNHDSSDFFIIQFMRDPASGSLILNAQGLWLSGTNAAAYQLIEGMLPNLASFDKAWYAYEWVDADGDKAPDLDEMHLKASGL